MEANSPEKEIQAISPERDPTEEFLSALIEIEPSLQNRIDRSVGNSHDSEDIVQETFLRSWKCFEEQDDLKTFPGWIFRTAFRLFINWCTKEKSRKKTLSYFRQKKEIEAKSRYDPSTSATDPATQCECEELFRILPNDCRDIFRDYIKEKYTFEDLAVKYGIHVNTARYQVRKAMQFLESKFQKYPWIERDE